jgi:hypothetical protein
MTVIECAGDTFKFLIGGIELSCIIFVILDVFGWRVFGIIS